jgi:hypothetical protein
MTRCENTLKIEAKGEFRPVPRPVTPIHNAFQAGAFVDHLGRLLLVAITGLTDKNTLYLLRDADAH